MDDENDPHPKVRCPKCGRPFWLGVVSGEEIYCGYCNERLDNQPTDTPEEP